MSPPLSTANALGPTKNLCSWINGVELSAVPQDIVTRAKYLILDVIACALVGAHLPWSETAANSIFKMEPEGSCTVLGWGERKLGPLAAALLNSTFIQGFELDDYHSSAPVHSNALLLPALFAAIESQSDQPDGCDPVSGPEFLRAYIIGCEVGPRVGKALHGRDLLSRGWHSGAVQGPSAAAAAGCALLRLSVLQTESALGIACTQAGGLMSAQFGSMAKRMQHGFASRNGLMATLLAQGGYTGIQDVFETTYGGFLACFSKGTKCEPRTLPNELGQGLGSSWELQDVRVKLHAAMAGVHGTIDCIDKLQHEHPKVFGIEGDQLVEQIDEIVTEHSHAAYEHGGWVLPASADLTTTAAQMSVQCGVAIQLMDRQVSMAQFGTEQLARPQIRALMAKVRPTHNEQFDKVPSLGWRTVVTVRLYGGQEIKALADFPRGISPPVSAEDIVEKWRRLVGDILTTSRMEAIEKHVVELENLKDMRDLIHLLRDAVSCPIKV